MTENEKAKMWRRTAYRYHRARGNTALWAWHLAKLSAKKCAAAIAACRGMSNGLPNTNHG